MIVEANRHGVSWLCVVITVFFWSMIMKNETSHFITNETLFYGHFDNRKHSGGWRNLPIKGGDLSLWSR